MTPSQYIKAGNQYPFDAPNSWWGSITGDAPQPKDWAHSTARGVIKFLGEKLIGISSPFFNGFKEDSQREEIATMVASIIKEGEISRHNASAQFTERADMAESIYGAEVENAISMLRKQLYEEIGKLLSLQAKGAVIPPDIVINGLRIPLVAKL